MTLGRWDSVCMASAYITLDASHFFVISAPPRFHNAKCLVPAFSPLRRRTLVLPNILFFFSFLLFIRALLEGKRGLRGDGERDGKDILLVFTYCTYQAPPPPKKPKKTNGAHTNMHGLSRRVINLLACRFGAWWWDCTLQHLLCIRSDRVSNVIACLISKTFWLVPCGVGVIS